jgi:hypothetical protein
VTALLPLADPWPLAVRVRTARHPGRCVLDRCPIRIGDRIGLLEGTGWAATDCIVAAQRAIRTTTSPTRKDTP